MSRPFINTFLCGFFLLLSSLSGQAAARAEESDPWQSFNRSVFVVNKKLDAWLLRPIALGYERYLPAQAKAGVRHFFNNVDDVNVVFNDLLQLKLKQAGRDSGRLLINTTIGIGGLFDPATKFGLIKHQEDFGQTLGYWGAGEGAYLMLPLFGASTVRDSIGKAPDYLLNPLRLIQDTHTRQLLFGTAQVSARARYLTAESIIRGDEYRYVRDAYLQRREYLIADGAVYDEFDDY